MIYAYCQEDSVQHPPWTSRTSFSGLLLTCRQVRAEYLPLRLDKCPVSISGRLLDLFLVRYRSFSEELRLLMKCVHVHVFVLQFSADLLRLMRLERETGIRFEFLDHSEFQGIYERIQTLHNSTQPPYFVSAKFQYNKLLLVVACEHAEPWMTATSSILSRKTVQGKEEKGFATFLDLTGAFEHVKVMVSRAPRRSERQREVQARLRERLGRTAHHHFLF